MKKHLKRPFFIIPMLAVLLIPAAFALYVSRPEPRCIDCNVILILLDALRADHLGCYGYERDTSPHIDSMALESIVFDNAVSQSAWTVPAVASMWTGLLPSRHRMLYFKNHGKLSKKLPTLAGIMKKNGYETVSYNGAGFVSGKLGLGAGFDIYESRSDRFRKNIDASVEWIKKNQGSRFFLFLHGYDIHRPYDMKDYNIFYDYKGEYNVRHFCVKNAPEVKTDEDLKYVVSQYDAGIRYVDHLMGEFFELLRSEGLLDNTILIITSDHGDEFYEHGNCDHIKSVYEELIHVPLIIRIPGFRAVRIQQQVPASTGILPTVLGMVGIEDEAAIERNNLLQFLTKRSFSIPFVVSETGWSFKGRGRKYWRCVRTGKWKQVYFKNVRGQESYELYDMVNDPGEKKNV
ncbi:MAG: sulfatase, partial [Pseudomonadota bacterium]